MQQGDPLGTLLFALIFHPLLHKIKDSCKLLLHAWYLNDGTVIGDSKEVARVPSLGVKLLGGAVSRDANFISGLAMRRAANVVDLMSLLPQLHDPQSELLLLRSCMGIAKLFFGLKTCQPVHMEEAALFFDKGLYSAKLVSSYAFVASRDQYWVLQDHILCNSGICGMVDDYVSALACLHDMIPSFDFSDFTNKETDFLFDICRRARISAKKEAPVNFLSDPSDRRYTLRPADVLVFGWIGGKHACVDLTGVSPLMGLSSRGFTAGQAALKAALSKVTKHEKACIKNQHVFIPFAFDTFGFLALEAGELLSRVQRVMYNSVMTPRSMNVGFKCIGFAI
ncbi:hypothetical protein Tco_1038695 [Tanacetum coccineum]